MWAGPVPGSLCPQLLIIPSGPVEQSRPGLAKILVVLSIFLGFLLVSGPLTLTAPLGLLGFIGALGFRSLLRISRAIAVVT